MTTTSGILCTTNVDFKLFTVDAKVLLNLTSLTNAVWQLNRLVLALQLGVVSLLKTRHTSTKSCTCFFTPSHQTDWSSPRGSLPVSSPAW